MEKRTSDKDNLGSKKIKTKDNINKYNS
jgi:hypothetical protein